LSRKRKEVAKKSHDDPKGDRKEKRKENRCIMKFRNVEHEFNVCKGYGKVKRRKEAQ